MRLSNKVLAVLSISAAGIALASASANAAGFYIQEQSVSGLGSAFAGSTTTLADPSTIYFNPAGMTKLSGVQAQAAAHLLIPNAELTDTGTTAAAGGPAIGTDDGGNPYSPTPVPNGYYSHQINDRLWAGIGVSAPFGLANDYGEDWFGRYDSTETELHVIDVQPTIAFKVNDRLSIGAGLNIQYADAELKSAVFATPALGGAEGTSTLKGDDISFGFNVGILAQPLENTTLGLSYRSAVSHELEGRVSTADTNNADFSVKGNAGLDLPDVATFGIAQGIGEKLTIMGQATWFGWNNFEDITAITEETYTIPLGVTTNAGDVVSSVTQNYQTTWAFAVGAEYEHSDTWTFRGGMQFDETPTTDEYRTSRTPDGDRTWLSLGATYSLNENIDLDLAGTYIWIDDEEINLTRNTATNPTTVSADTEGNVGILAVGFTYKF